MSSSNCVHGRRNCSQEGSRTASRSQSRSIETVDKLQPGGKPNSFAFRNPGQPRWSRKLQPGGKPTVSEQAVHAPRRQQEKQRPDEKISVRRLLQGTVRDLILLTMWVISPTIVVIFVRAHWSFRMGFFMIGCCPSNSPCSNHVQLDYERMFILSRTYFQTLSPTAC